ncbi:unnamed protein product [Prunus armeniaca]
MPPGGACDKSITILVVVVKSSSIRRHCRKLWRGTAGSGGEVPTAMSDVPRIGEVGGSTTGSGEEVLTTMSDVPRIGGEGSCAAGRPRTTSKTVAGNSRPASDESLAVGTTYGRKVEYEMQVTTGSMQCKYTK